MSFKTDFRARDFSILEQDTFPDKAIRPVLCVYRKNAIKITLIPRKFESRVSLRWSSGGLGLLISVLSGILEIRLRFTFGFRHVLKQVARRGPNSCYYILQDLLMLMSTSANEFICSLCIQTSKLFIGFRSIPNEVFSLLYYDDGRSLNLKYP